MPHVRFLLIFISLFFINKSVIHAQDDKFKSIFIYNFTKLIEWPADKQSAEFIITVYGNSGITSELKALAAKMKVNNKPIVIKQVTGLSPVPVTHILYICKDKTTDLSANSSNMINKNILIITEKPSACNAGSAINFVSNAGNLGFEINPANVEKAGLKVSSQLLSLGTVIK